MAKISIHFKSGKLTAELKDSPTAKELLKILPINSKASTWGEEVYFQVPVKSLLETDAAEVVDPGTVCFWVEGRSVAIPFGPTPVSRGKECRLVTRVNILGKIYGDLSLLKSIADGDPIRVELAQ